MFNVNPYPLFQLFLLFLLFHPNVSARESASALLTDRFILHSPSSGSSSAPQEYIDPTRPSLLLPDGPPSCSLPVLRHDFANTYGSPPASATYSPPADCPAPWAHVVLDLSVACAGDQYDRIAAVWLDGAELLRTSTAEPTESGVFWRVRKDVTRYSALLRRSNASVAMMLENIVNDVYTGVYHVNVSLDFYQEEEKRRRRPSGEPLALGFFPQDSSGLITAEVELGRIEERLDFSSVEAGNPLTSKAKVPSLYEEPADLIIPISNEDSAGGFWFRIQNESDAHFKNFKIPNNTYMAVLEIYVSYHSNDEFWYSNPPDEYIKKNNLTTGRGNGSFREVVAKIDGQFVGSVVPFPVIFTGGINPLFWAPVVSLGAFDLPSYNVDLTPFLGLLLDGQLHNVSLGVTDGIDFWLVDANLHLWLDPHLDSVTAELVSYKAPEISVSRRYMFHLLNGTFKIEAGRKIHFSGWVNSSLGNLTTDVDQKLKYKSLIEFMNDGNYKGVHMKGKVKTDVRIRTGPKAILSQGTYKSKYPLLIATLALPGENNTYTSKTNLTHTLYEEYTLLRDKVVTTSALVDRQDAEGWMLVQDHSVLSGSAGTRQTYQYRDDNGSYLRKVSARDGVLLSDNTTSSYLVASL
ncbi:peptide-N4-(N-acetyl-beta-glucosaminyl)asparagine amidase A [Elaeis guineensis]|uniref:Peptide-N4-(N-acetyl-beta- glucosaminyl)asparagine amidase A n=1 Tax=Elaeis guineensis var. tenera TaxID=51953 RepID=A0A6I9R5W1_ELAGV|nr:peptide-N4-(N-acetyl-beta-glucosaminyl)asparagine amidase A [Elaeis guineensis]